MALIGYARVSSVGQSLAVQLDKLQDCDPIFQEKRSGTSDNRPQLAACLQYVRRGDTLVVTKLDRLARSTLHLCQLAETLHHKGVALRVLDQAIDTSDATGRLLFHMLGAIAQFETEIRAERQLDGIANARARGIAFGRRPALTPEQVTELRQRRQQGVLIKTLMADYGLGKTALYRYLNGVELSAVDGDAAAGGFRVHAALTSGADTAILSTHYDQEDHHDHR
ncbi:MAG: recombinase family protein [Herpetosiphonaceae bacterium]|nr:recombinase family protein [Herpetosiphonaceae bacterium]